MKKITVNLSTLLIIAIVIIILGVVGFKIYQNKVNKLKGNLETEVKLKNALLDKVTYYQNKEKEWVAEKLTIQESIKNLEKMNEQLTVSQRELLTRVKELNKSNEVITAALIETKLKVDSLLLQGKVSIDTTNKKISFTDTYKEGNKEMTYDFTVGNVLPSSLEINPTFTINSLEFPNKQFVSFQWKNDKKKGYPISFSVSNSNDFFSTVNIESYAIPQLNKEIVNPNGWQKIQNFFVKNQNTVIFFGIGGLVGATTCLLLVK